LTEILSAKGFSVIALKQRGPVSKLEYPYKKLLLVSQADRGYDMPLATTEQRKRLRQRPD